MKLRQHAADSDKFGRTWLTAFRPVFPRSDLFFRVQTGSDKAGRPSHMDGGGGGVAADGRAARKQPDPIIGHPCPPRIPTNVEGADGVGTLRWFVLTVIQKTIIYAGQPSRSL